MRIVGMIMGLKALSAVVTGTVQKISSSKATPGLFSRSKILGCADVVELVSLVASSGAS